MLPVAFVVTLYCLFAPLTTAVVFSTPPKVDDARPRQPAAQSTPHFVKMQPIGVIQTRPTVVYKPRSLEALHERRRRKRGQTTPFEDKDLEWDAMEVIGPNVEDRRTLAQLARMAGNAYALPGQKNWYDVDPAWRMSFPFGWEEEDGFRGHVFLSSDNNTVILSIKGTTVQGPTSRLDRYNDNLMFSCCCAKMSWVVKTVCDCFSSHMRCDDQCLTDALVQDSLFYSIGTRLVDDLFRIYPTANLWLVGHSLGGALASLLGATYGVPAVAFESPGERMAAYRLNLPIPPPIPTNETSLSSFFPSPHQPRPPPITSPLADYITHVYHTADPIPFGTCSGLYSACATAGYALETKCHLGKSIILDTVNKLRWLVDVRKHIIREVVHLLDAPEEGGREVDWGTDEPEEGEDPEEPKEPDPWGSLVEEDEEVEVGVEGGLGAVAERVLRSVMQMTGLGQDLSLIEGRLWGWGPGLPGRGKKNKDKKGKKDKKKEDDKEGKISSRVPKPVLETDCVDCHRWEFGHFKDEV